MQCGSSPLHKNMVSDFTETPTWMSATASRTGMPETAASVYQQPEQRLERGRRHYEGTSSTSALHNVFHHASSPSLATRRQREGAEAPEAGGGSSWRFGHV